MLGFLIAGASRPVRSIPDTPAALIRGRPVTRALPTFPPAIDMVDVFRNSANAAGAVDEALKLDPLPRVIWMQLGVINEEAAARARAKGVTVVMNRCPKIEFGRLFGAPRALAR